MKYRALSILVIITFSGVPLGAQRTLNPRETIYPGKTWQKTDSPNGWDAKKLDTLVQFTTDSTNATALVIIEKGKLLLEYGDIKELSYLASCRKSVCAMLYGPYVEDGTIDLHATLEQLGLDDLGGLLPVEKKATIQNILSARSGVYHPASNPGDNTENAPKRGTVQPGSFWLYNNWDFNMAGYILEKATGKEIYALVDSMLAKPLQMEDWDIRAQHKEGDLTRSKYPAYHMWFSAEDMARIGYLMLRNGKWKDRQLISASWVHILTTPVTTYAEASQNHTAFYHFGYGYCWWLWDKSSGEGPYRNAYTAIGAYGQYITVMPALDLVVVLKTKADYGRATSTARYLRLLDKLIAAQL